jgi:hypothetical protein
MGWDGNTAQTVLFVIALLVWLRVYKGGWITGFFYYIGVASPLWHVVNGEQMYADGAWGGLDSYEVMLALCVLNYGVGLWQTNTLTKEPVLAAGMLGGIFAAVYGWPGVAVAEVVCGLDIWRRLLVHKDDAPVFTHGAA